MNPQLNGGDVNCAVLSLCAVLLLPVMLPVLHFSVLVWERETFGLSVVLYLDWIESVFGLALHHNVFCVTNRFRALSLVK